MSDMDLVIGYDAAGAFGPTVLIKTMEQQAVIRLREALVSVARGEGPLDLGTVQGVRLVGLESLRLSLAEFDCDPRLTMDGDPPKFSWVCGQVQWQEVADLLEPLADGAPGHQYLTDEGRDAAVIEVSYLEPSVGESLLTKA